MSYIPRATSLQLQIPEHPYVPFSEADWDRLLNEHCAVFCNVVRIFQKDPNFHARVDFTRATYVDSAEILDDNVTVLHKFGDIEFCRNGRMFLYGGKPDDDAHTTFQITQYGPYLFSLKTLQHFLEGTMIRVILCLVTLEGMIIQIILSRRYNNKVILSRRYDNTNYPI